MFVLKVSVPSTCALSTDTDECNSRDSNNCDVYADCVDFKGGYGCVCKKGYEGDGFNCTSMSLCVLTSLYNLLIQ